MYIVVIKGRCTEQQVFYEDLDSVPSGFLRGETLDDVVRVMKNAKTEKEKIEILESALNSVPIHYPLEGTSEASCRILKVP